MKVLSIGIMALLISCDSSSCTDRFDEWKATIPGVLPEVVELDRSLKLLSGDSLSYSVHGWDTLLIRDINSNALRSWFENGGEHVRYSSMRSTFVYRHCEETKNLSELFFYRGERPRSLDENVVVFLDSSITEEWSVGISTCYCCYCL